MSAKEFPQQQSPEQEPALGYEPYPMDWARRGVSVRRNANPETGEPARTESGWHIDGETSDGKMYGVVKWNEDGSSMTKIVPKDVLLQLQTDIYNQRQAEKLSAPTISESLANRAVSQAVTPVEVPERAVTLEDRLKAGYNIPRQELVDAGLLPGKSPADKYTVDYVNNNPYAHLVDSELSESDVQQINDMMDKEAEKKGVGAQTSEDDLRRRRAEADHKYNLAMQAGATHEEAQASADRVYDK